MTEASNTSRFVPSSFDPHDPTLTAVALPEGWRWDSCEEIFKRHAVRGVMSRLPLFWQAEIPLFEAARAAGAYIFLNDVKNMPVGAAALAQGVVDTVITSGADAEEFVAFLEQKDTPVGIVWIVIHPASDVRALPAGLLRPHVIVYEEIHRSPLLA